MRFLLALLLCASGTAYADKLHFDAYSVQVPPSQGWLVTRGGAYDIAFGTALTPTHTWAITAAAVPLGRRFEDGKAFLAYVRESFIRNSDPVRFRIVQTRGRVEQLHGAMCARVAYRAEDHLAAGGEAAYFIIEVTQVTCIHPSAPDTAIELGYHERYLPGEQGGAFTETGEYFVRSVRFWRPVPGYRLAASPALREQAR